jgi:Polyphosphate kinase 2 (PPK2)/XFP N-terminal domain
VIYVTGPGHGGPGLVAHTYLEGTYSEFYPNISQDEEGMKRLFTQFSSPGIVLRTPKGWTGPKEVDGKKTEGFWRSHQVPMGEMHENPKHVKLLEDWMKSYRPEELFDANGRLKRDLAELAPAGARRMGANPHGNGGLLLKDLQLPDFRAYAVAVPRPGASTAEATRVMGKFLVMRSSPPRSPRLRSSRSKEQHRRFLELCPLVERFVIEGGIQLIKIWLEVSNKEQKRRFEARIDDPLRQWKLSPMDLPSRERWFEYSRARDMMLEATDTKHAPWYVLRSDDKRRARLNCIAHLLKLIPYKKVPRERVKLPKRSKRGAYDDQASLKGRKFVPERY